MESEKIRIFNNSIKTPVKKEDIESYLKKIETSYHKNIKYVNIILLSRSKMLEINRMYLKKDTHTDVIAFNLEDEGQPVEGEVYISEAQVRENAKKYNQMEIKEIHRVIIHGILHLMGEKDATAEQKEKMHQKEEEFLNEICFT